MMKAKGGVEGSTMERRKEGRKGEERREGSKEQGDAIINVTSQQLKAK